MVAKAFRSLALTSNAEATNLLPTAIVTEKAAHLCAETARESHRETHRPMAAGADRRPSYTRRVEDRGHGRRLARSTAIFSLATGLSRILGLIREMVSSYFFGASGRINSFTVAFQIPNLVRALLADAAISSAFVPVFSELLEKGERKRAWRVASSLFWLFLLGLGGLTALFMLLAPWLMAPFG